MHASLLRLGLVPLPRVECSIEIEVLLLCTTAGLVENADEGTISSSSSSVAAAAAAAAATNEGEGDGGNEVCTITEVRQQINLQHRQHRLVEDECNVM